MSLVMTHNATTLHDHHRNFAQLCGVLFSGDLRCNGGSYSRSRCPISKGVGKTVVSQSSSNDLSDTNTPTVQLEPGVECHAVFGAFFVRITLPLIVIQIGLFFCLFLHTACMVCSSVTFGIYGDTFSLGITQVLSRNPRRKRSIFSVDVRLLLSQCRWQKSRKSRGFFSSFLILLS